MPILSHLHQLFNTETCHAYIHTLRWQDRPLQCPRCQSQDVDPWGNYLYRPGCKRYWCNGCKRTFNDLRSNSRLNLSSHAKVCSTHRRNAWMAALNSRLRPRLVVYSRVADNVPRPPPSRLRGVLQSVMISRIGFSGSRALQLTGPRARRCCLVSRSSSMSIPYPNCDHGGTRNRSTSREVLMYRVPHGHKH
jgi:hypothetical protein